jgi:hypothetical protein
VTNESDQEAAGLHRPDHPLVHSNVDDIMNMLPRTQSVGPPPEMHADRIVAEVLTAELGIKCYADSRMD